MNKQSSPSIWQYVVSVKSMVKILSNFVAFLENTSFTKNWLLRQIFWIVTKSLQVKMIMTCNSTILFNLYTALTTLHQAGTVQPLQKDALILWQRSCICIFSFLQWIKKETFWELLSTSCPRSAQLPNLFFYWYF